MLRRLDLPNSPAAEYPWRFRPPASPMVALRLLSMMIVVDFHSVVNFSSLISSSILSLILSCVVVVVVVALVLQVTG